MNTTTQPIPISKRTTYQSEEILSPNDSTSSSPSTSPYLSPSRRKRKIKTQNLSTPEASPKNLILNLREIQMKQRILELNPKIDSFLNCIRPSLESEEKRENLFNDMSKILKSVHLEPFLFGSAALKTYLPDGDIDITVVEMNGNEETPWYARVLSALQNKPIDITDIKFINAEIKLIKVTFVNNICIDITYGQIGGIATLCYLQRISDNINSNFLFKKSVILLKCWCYYEARILGSHHALLSTYAITTLLICIFNLFREEIESPIQALYKFLSYFSKFDWEKYVVTIVGPIPKNEITHFKTVLQNKNYFFAHEFVEECETRYGDCSEDKMFFFKHMNIVDTLRNWNNLGRSVSFNSFFRIKRAFTKGFAELDTILCSNPQSIFERFFPTVYKRFAEISSHVLLQLDNNNHIQQEYYELNSSVVDHKLDHAVELLRRL